MLTSSSSSNSSSNGARTESESDTSSAISGPGRGIDLRSVYSTLINEYLRRRSGQSNETKHDRSGPDAGSMTDSDRT